MRNSFNTILALACFGLFCIGAIAATAVFWLFNSILGALI